MCVYRELHILNAIHLPPCAKAVVTKVTCCQHDKFGSDWKKGTISFEKGNLFHVINIILPVLVQFRVYQNLHQKVADLHSQFYINYLIISLINSVCLSSNEKFKGRTSTKVSFRIVSAVIFTHVNV